MDTKTEEQEMEEELENLIQLIYRDRPQARMAVRDDVEIAVRVGSEVFRGRS